MDLKSTWDSKMHYIVFTTTINDNFGIHDFYPVLPMGKTYPFTHFHPVLPNRFYPVGKTYHANPGYLTLNNIVTLKTDLEVSQGH